MNEEEKAIEWLKNDLKETIEMGKRWGFQEEIKNKKELINLIEKQQKQIEELNIRLQEEINEKCKLKTELYLNSIPKSKIENKIATYRRVVADSNDGDLIHDLRTAIHILEKLLEND